MDFKKGLDMADELKKKHLSSDWVITLNGRNSSLGLCKHSKKTIEISYHHILKDSEWEVKDTILHEIAHALTPNHHHDIEWKRACVKIGAIPSRVALT